MLKYKSSPSVAACNYNEEKNRVHNIEYCRKNSEIGVSINIIMFTCLLCSMVATDRKVTID